MNDFHDIYGNKKIITYMQKVITINKIPHAFIVNGENGMGKKLISNTFAKTLQCEEHGINPCNKCVSCITFDNGNHTDVFFVEPTGKKSIGIDDVRDKINKIVPIRPYRSAYKIFIINKANTLTVQAQNALLKTIEEPPPYAIFILLSNNYNNFLPTILSRCVLLKLNSVNIDDVKNYLIKNKKADIQNALMISRFSRGNIGKSLLLLDDEDFILMREKVLQMIIDIRNKKVTEIFKLVSELEIYKEKINDVLEIIYLWFRDLLIYKEMKNDKFIFDKNNIELIKKNALEYSLESLYNKLDEINKAKMNLKYNGNFQLTMEVMFFNINNRTIS